MANNRRRKVPNFEFEDELKKAIELDSIHHLFKRLILMVDGLTKSVYGFERYGIMKKKEDTNRKYGEIPGRVVCNKLSEIEMLCSSMRLITYQVRAQRRRKRKLNKELIDI